MTANDMTTRTETTLWLLIVALIVAGCASGPAFEKIDHAPADKALIYVYRPPAIYGAALVPYVVINKSNAMPLNVGGYYPYFVAPGEVTISITHTGRRSITINVKAGETYFVKAGTVVMALGIPYIEQVSAEIGLAEIAECKRLPEVAGLAGVPEYARAEGQSSRSDPGSYPRSLMGGDLAQHVGRIRGIEANGNTRFPFTLSVTADGKAERICKVCPVQAGTGTMTLRAEEGVVCFQWEKIPYPNSGCFQVFQTGARTFEMRGTNRERLITYSVGQ